MRLLTTIESILVKAKPRERRRILEHMHGVLYAKAIALITTYSYCQVQKCNGCLTCLNGRERQDESFCCSGCKHLSKKKGCTVEALSCRAWYCNSVASHTPRSVLNKVKELQEEIRAWHLDTFRGSKSQAITSALKDIRMLKRGEVVGYWSFGNGGGMYPTGNVAHKR